MKPNRGRTDKSMRSFQKIPILSCSGGPSPSSARLSPPLLGVPGQDRPGDVYLVSSEPLVPASSHPVVLLQMGDHRLDSGPLRCKLSEPGRVFQRSLCLAHFGNGVLRDTGQIRRGLPGLGSVSPFRRQLLRKRSGGRLPSIEGVLERRRIVPVVRVLGMRHKHAPFIDSQGDLDPVLVGLSGLVLRDAGDLRLMDAVKSRRSRDLPEVVLRLGHDPFQNPRFRPESFSDPDQDGGHRLQRVPAQTLSDLPEEAGKTPEGVLSHRRKFLRCLLGSVILIPTELRHRQHRLPAYPFKSPKSLGNGHSQVFCFPHQSEHPHPGLLEKANIGRVGDVLLHRRGVDPHDLPFDRASLDHLLPDNRFNRLSSLRSQALSKPAQGRGLHMMGLVGWNLAEGYPDEVLVKARFHHLIRKIEPVLQDHEPHHQPGRFGRTSLSGSVIGSQNPVDLLPVDLSGQLYQAMVRIHMAVVHPLEQARLGSRRMRHNRSSRRKGEKTVRFLKELCANYHCL